MIGKFGLAIFGIAAVAGLAVPAVAGELVRIETRPFYGATVTVEAGVRVFRPLPAPSRVIINPGGKTPLSLSFYDTRSYDDGLGHGHAGNYPDDSYQDYGSPPIAQPYGYGGGRFRAHKRRRMAGDSAAPRSAPRRRMRVIRRGKRPAR